MPKLPRISGSEAIRALKLLGFEQVRQSGSHKIYRNSEGVRVTVPFHARKVLHPKLLLAILRDAGLTPDDLGD